MSAEERSLLDVLRDYVERHPEQKDPGYSPTDIVTELGLNWTRERVRQVLSRELHVPTLPIAESAKRNGARRRERTDATVNQYDDSGLTQEQIAAITGISAGGVGTSERRQGKSRRRQSQEKLDKQMLRHRGTGETQAQIAAAEHRKQSQVAKWEIEHGFGRGKAGPRREKNRPPHQ